MNIHAHRLGQIVVGDVVGTKVIQKEIRRGWTWTTPLGPRLYELSRFMGARMGIHVALYYALIISLKILSVGSGVTTHPGLTRGDRSQHQKIQISSSKTLSARLDLPPFPS